MASKKILKTCNDDTYFFESIKKNYYSITKFNGNKFHHIVNLTLEKCDGSDDLYDVFYNKESAPSYRGTPAEILDMMRTLCEYATEGVYIGKFEKYDFARSGVKGELKRMSTFKKPRKRRKKAEVSD